MKKIFTLILIFACFLVNDLSIINNIGPNNSDLKYKIIKKTTDKDPRKGCKNGSLK